MNDQISADASSVVILDSSAIERLVFTGEAMRSLAHTSTDDVMPNQIARINAVIVSLLFCSIRDYYKPQLVHRSNRRQDFVTMCQGSVVEGIKRLSLIPRQPRTGMS